MVLHVFACFLQRWLAFEHIILSWLNFRCAAELELEDGDVLHNKQRVWENAESQAAMFKSYIAELREQGFDFDADSANV